MRAFYPQHQRRKLALAIRFWQAFFCKHAPWDHPNAHTHNGCAPATNEDGGPRGFDCVDGVAGGACVAGTTCTDLGYNRVRIRNASVYALHNVSSALLIFIASFVALTVARVPGTKLDRPTIAMAGATLMVAAGGLPLANALAAIDLHVLLLLFGTMMIAAYLEHAQFFRYVAYLVLTRTRTARTLLLGVVMVSGVLSAFLLNDTVCIVLTPLVVTVARQAQLPPLPFVLAVASAANIGGIASVTGNPQNMLIAAAAGPRLPYGAYLAVFAPIAILCLGANYGALFVLFRRQLPNTPLANRAPPKPAFDRQQSMVAIAALVLFATLAAAGVSLTGAAMIATTLLVTLARIPPRTIVPMIDWPLLVFFAGLFVMMAGLAHSGAMATALDAVAPHIHARSARGVGLFVAVIVAGSNAVSNVPFVLLAVHLVPGLTNPTANYALLAVVSTLAGNLTPLGSIANIIALERAGPYGRIRFAAFVGRGAVLTTVSLLVAAGSYALLTAIGYAPWFGLGW